MPAARPLLLLLCCTQEYRRAAFVLSGVGGPKALFLRCYALYLAGEKRRE